jgi:hypothetical protein
VCVLSCVHIAALRRADPPSKGVLPTVHMIKKILKRPTYKKRNAEMLMMMINDRLESVFLHTFKVQL